MSASRPQAGAVGSLRRPRRAAAARRYGNGNNAEGGDGGSPLPPVLLSKPSLGSRGGPAVTSRRPRVVVRHSNEHQAARARAQAQAQAQAQSGDASPTGCGGGVLAQAGSAPHAPGCVVHRHGGTTTTVYSDASMAPVQLHMTQSVRKSNDRSKVIPDVRPPLYVNDTGVAIFFAGNGLFPLYVDITAAKDSGFDMTHASPPAVSMYSYPDSSPAKHAREVDPMDWELPAFRRVNSSTYVLKLGFKKGIGATRFFFLNVTLTSGNTTVTLTSGLFKVATKPRKLVIGNMESHWTAATLREMCPDLCARSSRGKRGFRAASSRSSDNGEVDIHGPTPDSHAVVGKCADTSSDRNAFAILFRTPSRCLGFFADHYLDFFNLGATFHLVPKRPLKMRPPADLNHVARTELKVVSGPPAATMSPTVSCPPHAPITFLTSGTYRQSSSVSSASVGQHCGAGVVVRRSGSGHCLPVGISNRRSGSSESITVPAEIGRAMSDPFATRDPVGLVLPVAPSARTSSGASTVVAPTVRGGTVVLGPTIVTDPTSNILGEEDLLDFDEDMKDLSDGEGEGGNDAIELPVAPPQPAAMLGAPGLPMPAFERGISISSVNTADFLDIAQSMDTFFDEEPGRPMGGAALTLRLNSGGDLSGAWAACDSPLAAPDSGTPVLPMPTTRGYSVPLSSPAPHGVKRHMSGQPTTVDPRPRRRRRLMEA